MANEQTSVPLFVADTILTAAQQNISAGTGVPVFATTVTRDAGFGGANKALAEGQLCYLSASNIVQYYDGAAWATVGPAAAGGMTLINTTTFSTVTSFSVPASTFTTTYDNYYISMSLNTAGTGANFSMRLRAAGTDVTSADYNNAFNGQVAATTLITSADASQTSARISFISDTPTILMGFSIYFYSPQKATRKSFVYNNNCTKSDFGGIGYNVGGGYLNVATQCDSVTFISSVASNITGTCRVYGISNSQEIMTNPNTQDGETTRPMTDAEYAQWQADNAEAEAQAVAQAEAQSAKDAARQAVLDKLGLTADEAAALLG